MHAYCPGVSLRVARLLSCWARQRPAGVTLPFFLPPFDMSVTVILKIRWAPPAAFKGINDLCKRNGFDALSLEAISRIGVVHANNIYGKRCLIKQLVSLRTRCSMASRARANNISWLWVR
jgi:hypothetical protein